MFANVLYNDIYGEGRAVGREEGMAAGREEAIISLYHDGVVSKETAMEKLEMTEEEFEEYTTGVYAEIKRNGILLFERGNRIWEKKRTY